MKGIEGVTPLDTDSGYKDVESYLATGWTADNVFARRYGCVVNVIVTNLDYSSGGSTTALTLPDGFRPDYTVKFPVTNGTAVVEGSVTAAGLVVIPTTVDNVELNITFMTSNDWPAI